MIQVYRNLEKVSSGYSVFERDQLLTHCQLNSISDYCGDQARLTRVELLGVGIVCGLRVSMSNNLITVTKGVALTTDGDILHLETDTVYDRYNDYSLATPDYSLFHAGEKRIPLYDLVEMNASDVAGTKLSLFSTNTGKSLDSMVAVLYVESYVNDEDICSGTDCDNLGKKYISKLKLLMVEKSMLGLLNPLVPTSDQAARKLNEIAADRPLIGSSASTPALLAQTYRTACNSIHSKLVASLRGLYANCSTILADVFTSDPSSGWISKLEGFKTSFASSSTGIQYYYDFLKDLVETWNSFRSLLFGDRTLCSPDLKSFPKHVLLGNVVPGTTPDANRTPFYPSALSSRTNDRLNHAKFLAKKLNTLIQTFAIPGSSTIRITPSSFEDRDLEERAIPYYYKVDQSQPIQQSWSYQLSQTGMEASNYSYNAASYGAIGGAANPLTSQIGRFSFFRIEGHLGQSVSTVLSAIEAEIKAKCIPIAVRSVSLGSDRTKVIKKFTTRYSDMHRLHYVLRQDVAKQLSDVAEVSKTFKDNVDKISQEEEKSEDLKVIAAEKQLTVASKTAAAIPKLKLSFSQYSASDPVWKSDLNDAMKAAGEFKSYLSDVTKTDLPTPIDSILGSTHIRWLDWIGDIIKKKEEKEDEKLLLANFVSLHPGIEHFAGVVRGGTFILAYDTSNTVVADFMLPYFCCETDEEEAEEPELPESSVKSNLPKDKGIRIVESLNKKVDKLISPKLSGISQTLGAYKDTLGAIAGVAGKAGVSTAATTPTETAKDAVLEAKKQQAVAVRNKVSALRSQAVKVGLTDTERTQLEEEVKKAESELGAAAAEVAEHISKADASIEEGSEGHSALQEVATSISLISNATTAATVATKLNLVSSTGITTAAKTEISKIAGRLVK